MIHSFQRRIKDPIKLLCIAFLLQKNSIIDAWQDLNTLVFRNNFEKLLFSLPKIQLQINMAIGFQK